MPKICTDNRNCPAETSLIKLSGSMSLCLGEKNRRPVAIMLLFEPLLTHTEVENARNTEIFR